MSEELVEPKTALMSIIDELANKMHEYTSKPNANLEYINRQRKLIDSLYQVCESLLFYDLHPVLVLLNQSINDALKLDPSIETFQVNINLKPVTNRISVIDIDIF